FVLLSLAIVVIRVPFLVGLPLQRWPSIDLLGPWQPLKAVQKMLLTMRSPNVGNAGTHPTSPDTTLGDAAFHMRELMDQGKIADIRGPRDHRVFVKTGVDP